MPPWASSVLPPPPLSLEITATRRRPARAIAVDRPAMPEPTTKTSSSSSPRRPCTSLASAGRTDRDHPLDRLAGALRSGLVDLNFINTFSQAIEQPLRCGHFHKTALGPRGHGFESGLRVGVAQLVEDPCLGCHQGMPVTEVLCRFHHPRRREHVGTFLREVTSFSQP